MTKIECAQNSTSRITNRLSLARAVCADSHQLNALTCVHSDTGLAREFVPVLNNERY